MTDSIQLIVLDIDGTLLNSQHQMTERTETVLKAVLAQGVKIVLATGKTFPSAKDLIARLGLTTPGIFNQGLVIVQPDGRITYQRTLEADICRRIITYAEDRGFDVIAYSGLRLLVRKMTPKAEALATKYHEPMPEVVGPLQNILFDTPINKLMMVKADRPDEVKALRWQLNQQFDAKIRLMQAGLPDHVEALPPKSSKGVALRALLKDLNIAPTHVLAIGDGENDIEMIELAQIGIAMGNAMPELKAVAQYVAPTNDEDGVAAAIEKYVLKKPAESAAPVAAEPPQPAADTPAEKSEEQSPEKSEEKPE